MPPNARPATRSTLNVSVPNFSASDGALHFQPKMYGHPFVAGRLGAADYFEWPRRSCFATHRFRERRSKRGCKGIRHFFLGMNVHDFYLLFQSVDATRRPSCAARWVPLRTGTASNMLRPPALNTPGLRIGARSLRTEPGCSAIKSFTATFNPVSSEATS